ncbi:DUF4400 domain-containing protein [Hydrogenovibrio marinus]|uniref:DUF4400 domain-containing protein n=1 Tax=Hydrogenovibrio marinus TaxID=28885 RepID=UPI0004A7789D|nr:DUF4400 domain-containing protein [Hydrogenovibrio marinus]
MKPETVKSQLLTERYINHTFSPYLDEKAWNSATEYGLVQPITNAMANHIAKSHPTVSNKNEALENAWATAPESLNLMGLMIDYRIYHLFYMLPFFLVIAFPILMDAIFLRKKGKYQNSFISPTKHHVGSQVLGMTFSYLMILAIIAPFSVPASAFFVIYLIKMSGWWIWIVSLPKRI